VNGIPGRHDRADLLRPVDDVRRLADDRRCTARRDAAHRDGFGEYDGMFDDK
jgi:hypothetical protein